MKAFTKSAHKQWRYPQQERQSLRSGLAYVGVVLLLFSSLVLLSACSGIFGSPSQSGSPSGDATTAPSTSSPVVSPTSAAGTPTITLQVIGCPTLSINWDSLVGTHANVNKVQKVICGSLGTGSLDALIDVRYYSSDNKLDYYVYDSLFGTPTQRFSGRGLLNGDAIISSVGTLATAEVNPGDAIKGQVDLFKEYQWNSSSSSFVQILFPGVYPDMTRYQADQSQALVNSEIAKLQPGQPITQIKDSWRLTAGGVVAHLAHDIFHWNSTNVILPRGSSKFLDFTVQVNNNGTGGGGFFATVHHYNEVSTNIFEVWQITAVDGSSGISSPTAYAQLTSPVSISGSAIANGSVLGQIVFYDDMFTAVGTSGAIHSPAPSGYVQFTDSVSYHLGTPGLQEGVVAFYPTNQNNIALSNQAVMVKVFLSA